MKRKKTGAQAFEEGATQLPAPAEGVIDLDPASAPTEGLVGEVVAEQRKKRRAKTVKTAKPLVDLAKVRELQIEAFIEFLDGNRTKDSMLDRVAKLDALSNAATEIIA